MAQVRGDKIWLRPSCMVENPQHDLGSGNPLKKTSLKTVTFNLALDWWFASHPK